MKKKYLALLTALMLTAGISTDAQAAELKALNTQQANIVTEPEKISCHRFG